MRRAKASITVAVCVSLIAGAILSVASEEDNMDDNEDEWVPYVPKVEEDTADKIDIEVLKEEEIKVDVQLTFPDGGYRVVDWDETNRSGDKFTVDTEVERWTGASIMVITQVDNTYGLGDLTPGSYEFVFKAHGQILDSIEFDLD
ncbi:MAG: hypothetical protein KGY76_05160 [Candidatus Thermoplasmatota archaeon]|nr:hypothetical protein [Candidatus Thermoplasmatota archaeon]